MRSWTLCSRWHLQGRHTRDLTCTTTQDTEEHNSVAVVLRQSSRAQHLAKHGDSKEKRLLHSEAKDVSLKEITPLPCAIMALPACLIPHEYPFTFVPRARSQSAHTHAEQVYLAISTLTFPAQHVFLDTLVTLLHAPLKNVQQSLV